ncbi:helix-turn-helix domain-containing protein [Rhodococcus sp. 06-235-1A]|uniref:helix-turn-helix domain-containing protein n=1 Tax=Rhodococcus sp. 06-235-1A TaxID=2022508 RepID=UPI002795F717|nr:helix-turn-helix domain-containing protein [Rhodococcus sp. 06-235-1A]
MTSAEVAQAGSIDSAQLAATLPPELADVIAAALSIIARGGTVTIGSLPSELSTTTAADILDISRPTLMKLIKTGALPSYKVGSHTRLKASDVTAYRENLRNQQRAAFNDLRDYEDMLDADN